MKTTIYLGTIHLPHGSGGYVLLQRKDQEDIPLYEGSAECAEAIYKVLADLQNAQVDLSTTEIMMEQTRS